MQGVVKALREQNLLPRIVAGSSVGSIGKHSNSVILLQVAVIEVVFYIDTSSTTFY